MPTTMWLHVMRMLQLHGCISHAVRKLLFWGHSGVIITSPSLAHSPGSAGCYPLTAVTMRVAIQAELVVTLLAWRLVGGQSLRAGSVDSASHEHLLEVSLGVLRRASSRYPSCERPVLP